MWKIFYLNDEKTNYEISDRGEVRNYVTGNPISTHLQQGYRICTLLIDNHQKSMRVHRMVALTFIPNPENKPYVNHIDGNRQNNNIENLEWVTPSENSQHAYTAGLRKPSRGRPVVQYSLDGKEMVTFNSATEAARELNLQQSKITSCCTRARETTGDYQWRYLDDPNKDVKPLKPKYIQGRKVAQKDDEGNVIAIYPSYKEAARAVNGTSSAISRVCSGLNIHHKGYRWEIVEEIVQDEI